MVGVRVQRWGGEGRSPTYIAEPQPRLPPPTTRGQEHACVPQRPARVDAPMCACRIHGFSSSTLNRSLYVRPCTSSTSAAPCSTGYAPRNGSKAPHTIQWCTCSARRPTGIISLPSCITGHSVGWRRGLLPELGDSPQQAYAAPRHIPSRNSHNLVGIPFFIGAFAYSPD